MRVYACADWNGSDLRDYFGFGCIFSRTPIVSQVAKKTLGKNVDLEFKNSNYKRHSLIEYSTLLRMNGENEPLVCHLIESLFSMVYRKPGPFGDHLGVLLIQS